MLYNLCRPVVRRPDCSYHTGLNDPTFSYVHFHTTESLGGDDLYDIPAIF